MSELRTSEQCVWVRLPDIVDPLELQPYRFQVGCGMRGGVAYGATPNYPDVCPACQKAVRIAT